MAARHFKYTYDSELPPKGIFAKMIKSNMEDNFPDNNVEFKIDLNNERNKLYFSRRKELKNLMKSINSYLDNNSQSYFLTLYYMDLIFTNPDLERMFFSHFSSWTSYTTYNDIQMNNYVLLSLACLVVASKFNENDPHVPTMSSFIRLLYEYSKKKYIFNLQSLFTAEVVVVKLLKHKLNYYTIYHHLIFFFTHGIVFRKTIENSKISKKYSETKILEKIYIIAREIIDNFIDSDKYYDLYFGKNNYIVVVEIFLWSIEHILRLRIKDDENIFKLIFNINIPQEKHKEIYDIIEKFMNKKKGLENNTKKLLQESINTNNSKTATGANKNNTLNKAIEHNSEINFKFTVEPKSSVSSSTTYTNTKSHIPPKILDNIDNIDNDFQFYNGLIQSELNGFKSNYPNKHANHQSNQSIPIVKRDKRPPQSNIIYGQNNRVYLTSSKNITTGFQLNQNEIFSSQNSGKVIQSNKNMEIQSFKVEREPTDSSKNLNLIYRNNQNVNGNNCEKIIILNDLQKNRKKSLSCSKDGAMSYNYQTRPSANINSNIEKKLKLGESINKTRISESKKDIKDCYAFSPNQNMNKGENIIKKRKGAIVKKYQKVNNQQSFQNIPNKHNIFSDKFLTKHVNGEDLITKTQNLVNEIKYNSYIEQGPQDNKRGSNNKYIIDNDKMKQSYNNPNTIIINNNIHINTYIDNNNLNNNDLINDINKKNINFIFFNEQKDKKMKEILQERNPSTRNKNHRNILNNMNESKNMRNNNKSFLSFSQRI
jgi:hypothetical protein